MTDIRTQYRSGRNEVIPSHKKPFFQITIRSSKSIKVFLSFFFPPTFIQKREIAVYFIKGVKFSFPNILEVIVYFLLK